MSDVDFHQQLAEPQSSLEQTSALLREHGEQHWSSWAERCRQELNAYDTEAFDHVLGAYGGMGSFNDLLILGVNGHAVEPGREASSLRRPVKCAHA